MDSTATTGRRGLGHRRLSQALGAVLGLLCLGSAVAQAGPRDDLKTAYNKAFSQYNNLELDQALAVLDEAIKAAPSSDDPALAPLHVLRAGVIFSNTGDAAATKAALAEAVKVDYNVQVPVELRSEQFQQILEDARKDAGTAPDESVRHTPPTPACGADITFDFVVSGRQDDGQVVFYWRRQGQTEFQTVDMDTFGNLATAVVAADGHGDENIEYLVAVFDGNEKALASKGSQDAPLILELGCKKEEVKVEPEPEPPPPATTLPRFFLNLGFGTGFGIARGTADLSYRQYSPAYRDADSGAQFIYGAREYACSIARWYYPQDDLPSDPVQFQNDLMNLQAMFGATLPPGTSFFGANTPQSIALNYNQEYCSEHHPVKSGMASAPFHIAPEFGYRITKNLVVSVFARLQVVSGSKVYRDDPKQSYSDSFVQTVYDVNRQNAEGVRIKPGFAWGIGAKIKYFIGKDDAKFRLFAGGFGGFGTARLRVNMGFANDRNGNSIPDDREVGNDLANEDVPFDPTTNPCTAVWPYNNGCVPGPGNDLTNPGDYDRLQAGFKKMNADKSPRIDTVGIGRFIIGGTFGFHYQLVKNFALFGELQLGGWIGGKKAPTTSSFLIDLNVGPVITF